MNQDNAVAEALERLAALATPGPYDVGPCNLVRALRDDLAVPLFEPRDTFMDPIPAPTVRDGAGDLVFRAGSNGARTSRALKQEVVNSQLVAALLNNLPTIIAALKAQALRSQPSQPYAWLIERRVSPAQWSSELRPTGVGAFYSDPNRAHRFSTKEDAEEAMRNMAITPEERGQYFVSEHCWIDIPAQAQRVDEGGVS